jgi:hypothetical protein
VVVEVKTQAASGAHLGQLERYSKWLDEQNAQFRERVFLVAEGDERRYADFDKLEWAEVRRSLRRIMPELQRQVSAVKAAQVLAFVGAVEQNLIGLVSAVEGGGAPALLYGKTADHVDDSLPSWMKGGSAELNAEVLEKETTVLVTGVRSFGQSLTALDEFKRIARGAVQDALEKNAKDGALLGVPTRQFGNHEKWGSGTWPPSQGRCAEKDRYEHYYYFWWNEDGEPGMLAAVVLANAPTAERVLNQLRKHAPPAEPYNLEREDRWVVLTRPVVEADYKDIGRAFSDFVSEWVGLWDRADGIGLFPTGAKNAAQGSA